MLKIPLEVYPTQYNFLKSKANLKAFVAGIGAGKTTVGSIEAAILGSIPGSRGMIVAPTYGMLDDSTMTTFEELAGPAIKKINRSKMNILIRGGGTILGRSADNPDRLRGPNLDWAWIDEAGLCPEKTWEIVLGRLRKGGKMGKLFITTTPKGRNWVYKNIQKMEVFRARTRDNTYLGQDFVDMVYSTYTGKFAQQELEGLFVGFEGLVYDIFNRDIHVRRRDLGEFQYFVLCIDEGYVNPAAIAVMGVTRDLGFHVCKEYYKRGQLQSTVVQQALKLSREFNTKLCVVDPSAAGLIADLRNSGLHVFFHQDLVLEGIRIVQDLLAIPSIGLPRLTIDPSCIYGINEFESYSWKKDLDQPIKQNDHELDAIRQFFNWLYSEQTFVTIVEDPVRDEI